MDIWKKMLQKENLIVNSINFCYKSFKFFSIKERKVLSLSKAKYKDLYINQDVYLVLNGPSIKSQNLEILKGRNCVFVNQGFRHPLYKEISPLFHVFVDPKLMNGEWSIEWLDEILEMVPTITFVLPIKWYGSSKLAPYIERGISILWIPMYDPMLSLGVSGYSLKTCMLMGFNRIFILGFDGDGLAHEMLKSSNPYFYEKNKYLETKGTKEYIRDLYMLSRHFTSLHGIANDAKAKNIDIYNMTNSGIMDMFERANLSDLK